MRTMTRGALLLLAVLTMGEFGCSAPLARTTATPQDAVTLAGTAPVPYPTIPRAPGAPIPAPSETGDLGGTTTPIDTPMSDEVLKTTVASPCGYQTIIAPEVSHFPPVTDSRGAVAHSHDGLALAFPETAVTVQIHVAQPGLGDWGFAWSPDGHYVLGTVDEAGLFVVQVGDEERVRELSVAGAIRRGQSVAPDGHSIALVTGVLKPVSGGQKLSLYDVGRNALLELPIMVDPPWDVTWSPR